MVDVSTVELVALHLTKIGDRGPDSEGCVSFNRTTPGIVRALDVDDTISGRVELLTTLASMKEAGLLVEDHARAEGLAGRRNSYQLTEEGWRVAREVFHRVEDVTVDVLRDGDTIRVRLGDLDEEISDLTLVEALARTTDAGVLHRRDGTRTPEGIVGRQHELATLRETIEAVEAGATETVFVAGESGIGKTTLVEQVLEDAHDRGFAVLESTGTDEATEPYQPVRDALTGYREAAPVHLFEAPPTARDTDRVDVEDVADRRQALFADVAQELIGLTSDQPVALFLDDLHAADPGTLALLEYLATSLADARILLVGAYRPEELDPAHSLTGVVDALAADAVHLELGPLAETATRALVERTLDDRDVPQSFVDTIHDRTGGHPLFVEATVRQLREQGVVDPRTGHYPDDPDIPLPQEVWTAIERRLDALDEEARTVIEAASVVGTTVDFRVLSAVTGLSETDLREYVDLLVAARVWTWERGADAVEAGSVESHVATDGGQLRFANEVVRDAVRERFPDRRRRELHERVAEALERGQAEAPDAQAGTVARHYEQAGCSEQAVEYYQRAGDHAASVYAYETAVDEYERGLALAREQAREEEVLSLMKRIGVIHLEADAYEEADRYFEYVLERTDDTTTAREIAARRAELRNDRGEFDDAIEVADRALDSWAGDTATAEVRRLLTQKCWARKRKGELERARTLAETQLEMADSLDDPRVRSDALNCLGSIERSEGNLEASIEIFEEGIEAARVADAKRKESTIRNNLGVIYCKTDVEAAREMFEECLRLSRETNTPAGEMLALCNLGGCLEQLGEWEEALTRLEDALEFSRRLDTRQYVAANTVKVGTMHQRRGELARAREFLERGLDLAESVGYRETAGVARVSLARLECRQANVEAGEAHADAVIRTDEPPNDQVLSKAYTAKGRLELAQDDLEAARAAYERASDTESSRSLVPIRCGLTDVHRRAGRLAAAREGAETARQIADEQRNPLLSVEANVALGRVQRVDDPERATETLRSALEAARDLGASVHECEALYELGRSHHWRGDVQIARDSLEAALTLAEETGATLFERRCEDALEGLLDTAEP